MAFSPNGLLGIASWDNCAYIVDQNGNLLNKKCGWDDMRDSDYLNGVFGFVNQDDYVYLFWEGKASWKVIDVGYKHNRAIALYDYGFVACNNYCAKYDFDGHLIWEVEVGGEVEEAVVHSGYVYLANKYGEKLQVLDLSLGQIVKEIEYDEAPSGVSVCGNYLAVTAKELYLYDISDPADPKLLWKTKGLEIDSYQHSPAFSPDCKYIAVANSKKELRIYDVEGNWVYRRHLPGIWSVAWWRDRISIGYKDGKVETYQVIGYVQRERSALVKAMVVVSNPNSYDLKDYQVRVRLPVDLKNKPIAITYNDSPVPFCYETTNYECTTDPTKGNGYVWIKVPFIPTNGETFLKVIVGTNGAVSGDKVFDFYDDFSYPNGPFEGNEKWEVHRYSDDRSKECVIDNGILWLVEKSWNKGCNVLAKNLRVKYNDKVVIEFEFKVDYVCGNVNDGDGLSLVIDGKDTAPDRGCSSGFRNQNQGINVNVNTGEGTRGSVSVSNTPEACSIGSDDLVYIDASPKKSQLSDGIVKVSLTGSEVRVRYEDLNPDGGRISGSMTYPIWNPGGLGYLMLGAGTSCSECSKSGCNSLDSAHGVDWIRVRKYADDMVVGIVVHLRNSDRLR